MPTPLHPHRALRVARTAFRAGSGALAFGLSAAAETNRLRIEKAWKHEIEAAGRGDGPIVIGPWISEVGFEVLYWIPMLHRIAARAGWDPDRVTVITRGGAHCWYRDLAAHGIEIFDLLEPDELRDHNERRVVETGGQKHMGVTSLDRELARRAASRLPENAQLVHPSLMYNVLRYYWSWRIPPKQVLAQVDYRPLPDPGRPDIAERLPDEYVAVKAYHSSCFPPTSENQRYVGELVRGLAARTNVVLLSTGLRVDDHAEVPVARAEGQVIDAQQLMTPRDNLAVQTQVIKGASCLLSSYGGFSYLGPFLGVPSICFWSDANFNATHLELMRQAVDLLRAPRFVALDTADVALLARVLDSGLVGAGA
jgi:hypothetical protein